MRQRPVRLPMAHVSDAQEMQPIHAHAQMRTSYKSPLANPFAALTPLLPGHLLVRPCSRVQPPRCCPSLRQSLLLLGLCQHSHMLAKMYPPPLSSLFPHRCPLHACVGAPDWSLDGKAIRVTLMPIMVTAMLIIWMSRLSFPFVCGTRITRTFSLALSHTFHLAASPWTSALLMDS